MRRRRGDVRVSKSVMRASGAVSGSASLGMGVRIGDMRKTMSDMRVRMSLIRARMDDVRVRMDLIRA
jgi:hypothetical protein